MQDREVNPELSAAINAPDQPEYARGERPEVQILDEAAVQASAEEPAVEDVAFREVNSTPGPLALTLGSLIEELTKAGHPEPERWLETLENPPKSKEVDVKGAIYLTNRALRVLITERRDIPEADRSGALLSIVDAHEVQPWLDTLKPLTIPVLAKYNVGTPGLVKESPEVVAAREAAVQTLSPEENAAQQ